MADDESNDRNLLRRIVFRLVRKYLAGSTTASMLKTVKEINGNEYHATVTLLNEHILDQTKAKYNTTAYLQTIREMSRLGLNADISIRASQIGYGVDKSAFEKNMGDIMALAKSSGTRIWIEAEGEVDEHERFGIYETARESYDNIGFELMAAGEGAVLEDRSVSKGDIVRIWYPSPHFKGPGKRTIDASHIGKLAAKSVDLTVYTHDTKMLESIIRKNGISKRNLTFEIPLGYNVKRLGKLAKGKVRMSVYVPYGKDWSKYVIERIADGRMRGLAIKILDGSGNGTKKTEKNEKASEKAKA